MKIRILTYHCAMNYGAALQAFALKEVLRKYTDDIEIINYCPPFLSMPCGEMSLKKVLYIHIIQLIRKLIFQYDNKIKIKKFNNFKEKYLIGNQPTINDMKNIDQVEADIIFLGSDQIWNMKINGGDSVYFGNFNKSSNAILVSYAASIGNDNVSMDEIEYLSYNIKYLDMISVREELAKTILQQYTNKEISVVLDPTLLLDNSIYTRMATKINYTREYILLYQMEYSGELLDLSKKISKKLGLDVIEVIPDAISLKRRYPYKIYHNGGPCDFLGLIRDANLILTNSFHGVAFSIIFRKPFYVVLHKSRGDRIRNLLVKLGLTSRIIKKEGFNEQKIDYEVVLNLLNKEQLKSFAYIEKCIRYENKKSF